MSDNTFTDSSKVNASEERSSMSNTGRFGRTGGQTGAHEAVNVTGRLGRNQQTGAHTAAGATGRTGIRRSSATGAHQAVSNTGRLGSNTGRMTGRTGSVTAVTGIFSAANVTGRHEAYTEPVPVKPKVKQKKKQKLYIGSVIFAALVVIVIAITLRFTTQDKYETYYASAQACFAAGDYDNALANARRAANIRDTEEGCLLMAECYQAEGNFSRALEVLRAGNMTDPRIIEMIQSIEAQKESVAQAEIIAMAGMQYEPDTTMVNLSGTNSGSEQFSQLAKLTRLTSLIFKDNELESLKGIEQLLELEQLDVTGNRLQSLEGIGALTHLKKLILDGNSVSDLSPLYSLQSLTLLSVRNTQVSEEQRNTLSQMLPGCAIEYDGEAEGSLMIQVGDIRFTTDVQELDLSNRQMADVSVLSQCVNLKKLNLSGNRLTDVAPLMDLAGLEWLDIHENMISDLRSLIALSRLSYVDASNNSLYSTNAFGAMNGLKRLYLDHNEISDFSGLKNCGNLVLLSLNDTGLKDTDNEYLRNLKNMDYLYICDNPDYSGESFDKLNRELSGCYIEHSKLIYSITIGEETYRQDITELSAPGQGIVDLDGISGFENLETVDLSGNQIVNVYQFQNLKSPVVKLNLSNNRIREVTGIAGMTTLKELDLSYNQLTSVIPLLGLKNLTKLDVRGNNLTPDQLSKLRDALPCCEIIV